MNLKHFLSLKPIASSFFVSVFVLAFACDSPSDSDETDSGSGDASQSGDSDGTNGGTASSTSTAGDTGNTTGDTGDDSFFSGPQGGISFSVTAVDNDEVFTGTFSNWHFLSGAIPAEGLEGATFEAEIDMTSLTGISNPTILMHVNGMDYFDIMKWPTSTFSISEVKKGAQEGEYTAVASLNLRATLVDVPLVFSVTSESPLTVEGKANPDVKRSDWGMDEEDTEDKVTIEFAARLK